MDKLLPCPFCGGEDAIVINPRLRSCFETLENAIMRVACPDCGAGISFGYLNERWDELTEEHAKEAIRATISAWNRRSDAVPVVRGEWIENPTKDSVLCSYCHADWNLFDNDTYRFCYCPNCGAKMESEGST